MHSGKFNTILGQYLHGMLWGNYFFLLQFISVDFLVGLLQTVSRVNSDYDQCDVVLLVRALLMVIALHTKNPKKQQKALDALNEHFKFSTPPTLDDVYATLNLVTKERQCLCKMLVVFVTVYLSAPGKDITFDSLSINCAFEDVKCAYCMYILPSNFTATRPLDELSFIYRNIALPYFHSNRSCVPYSNVFLHMYNVFQDMRNKQKGITTGQEQEQEQEQKQELMSLLESAKNACEELGCVV